MELCLEMASWGLVRFSLISPSELSLSMVYYKLVRTSHIPSNLERALDDMTESSVSESSNGRRAATTAASA